MDSAFFVFLFHAAMKSRPNITSIIRAAIKTIKVVQADIASHIATDPDEAFSPVQMTRTGKHLLTIDKIAEARAQVTLRIELKRKKDELQFLGEEQLDPNENVHDLRDEDRLVVLVDMIDGTDLLARNLSNWCSAMVFLDPQADSGDKILAAFVGVPNDGIYYACRNHDFPYKYQFNASNRKSRHISLVKRTVSDVDDIANATVCFYGQKCSRVSTIMKTPFFDELPEKSRFYTIAGNPMMIKMIRQEYSPVDAVFDIHGQWPHDVVAGAYIAIKAGAVYSPIGSSLNSIKHLEEGLLRPNDKNRKLRYVLASTERLSRQLNHMLRKKDSVPS
ncbi:MAG TPA: hypothetical protein VGK48_14370 [Terriglobia bacterium]|jgi:fructose-1,6-bisphosphatase/inositol monophosphatase family enzyme